MSTTSSFVVVGAGLTGAATAWQLARRGHEVTVLERVISAENRARVIDYVRRTLHGLVPEPYAETTCIFTNTPGEDFVVDGVDGLTIASACSGHGAKFAPLLGRIVADTALGTSAPAKLRVA